MAESKTVSPSKTSILDDVPSISRLNDDCLVQIFSFLPIIDRIQLERVCKRWQRASNISWLSMKRLDFQDKTWSSNNEDNIRLTFLAIEKILKRCGNYIKEIEFSVVYDSKSHEKPFHYKADKKLFESVKKFCHTLECISVIGLTATSEGIKFLANNYADIKRLTLGPCERDCESSISYFFQKACKLQAISLNCNNITGDCFSYLQTESIERFSLFDEDDTLEMQHVCSIFRRLHGLKRLKIHFHENFTPESVVNELIMLLCANAETLKELVFIDGWYSSRRDGTFNLHGLIDMKNLQRLTLCGTLLLSNDALRILGNNCTELLDVLFQFSKCTHKGLKHILSLPKLRSLTLIHCEKVKNKVFKNATNLEDLELSFCRKITRSGLLYLLKNASKLKKITIEHCPKIKLSDLFDDMTKSEATFHGKILKLNRRQSKNDSCFTINVITET